MIRPATTRTVRCDVYTRKSTDEGLDKDFNSLDAQREAAEAYVASQKHEGWVCLAERYDDGGYTGGNMERPALRRLLTDVEAGKVDCLVVYKVDRLSRSLLDFARIMETLDRQGVSFVSVTQQFNTTHSMGRLTLNILFSFAQFEREIIAERTRDKMSAARRKGKWVGGMPVLGYDVDPQGGRLLVNGDEAARVRAIFELYVEHPSLIATVRELGRRGWTNKRWVTRKGRERGGRAFDKHSLLRLLSNLVYRGKVNTRGQVYEGEHEAIVDADLWQRVQGLLHRSGSDGGRPTRHKHGALLKGLLYCVPCGRAMVHAFTVKGNRRYRYYVCTQAQKRGWDQCPAGSVPAAEMERFVIEQVRCIGHDPDLVGETLRQARCQAEADLGGLRAERRLLGRELARCHAEARCRAGDPAGQAGDPPGNLGERIRKGEERLAEVRGEMDVLSRERGDEQELAEALVAFDLEWDSVAPGGQARLVRLLVERVGYDGRDGTISVTFRPTGIKTLAEEAGSRPEVKV